MMLTFSSAFELSRFCTTGLPSDVTVEVGDMSFHLHKVICISCHCFKLFRRLWRYKQLLYYLLLECPGRKLFKVFGIKKNVVQNIKVD